MSGIGTLATSTHTSASASTTAATSASLAAASTTGALAVLGRKRRDAIRQALDLAVGLTVRLGATTDTATTATLSKSAREE